ncbi:RNA-binding protein [Bacteroides heparinolyticus]|uniref:RNA-binding protein n=1 Tax=Prevotella heparinolytica TaxID=28113 RepID=UPI00359F8F94
MKAITLKQPFAYLVCSGVKDIENRTWKCPEKYIGKRVLIHAGMDRTLNLRVLTTEQYRDAAVRLTPTKGTDKWERGAIIGSVRITVCTINHPSIWAEKTEGVMVGHTFVTPKGVKTIYNWILEDAILFDKPILDVKGKLSFWESSCEILVCPKCGSHCLHNNSDVAIPGWGNPVCECGKCGYMIQESEFEFVI